jgi:RNA polymerase sigma-70 factor (ECF subfamily)
MDACRDFAAFRGSTREGLLVWLCRILQTNLAVYRRPYRGTRKRRVSREDSLDGFCGNESPKFALPVDPVTLGTRTVQRERVAVLVDALGRLLEDYRYVVLSHQYDLLTFEEIGQRLGRSAEAIRKLWSRALIRLTEELGPAHDRQE